MTRNRAYALAAVSAGLYVLLCWIFADGLFSTSNFFHSDDLAASSLLSYLLLGAIIVAGVYQARKIPAEGVDLTVSASTGFGQIDDPVTWKLLLGNVYFAVIWMPIRFFVGQEWLSAGEHKVRDDAWMSGGSALQGYWERAVAIPETGRPAITYAWFRDVLEFLLRHETYTWFAKVVAVGEVLVGLGLIIGALVGIAAFFGTLMNFNFQLAGSASTNPVLFGLGVFLVLGWKVAGHVGLDRYLLPLLGTPWTRGPIAHRTAKGSPAAPPLASPAD
jgi:thiosulfate dehydrogenase [quinone] large subunit